MHTNLVGLLPSSGRAFKKFPIEIAQIKLYFSEKILPYVHFVAAYTVKTIVFFN